MTRKKRNNTGKPAAASSEPGSSGHKNQTALKPKSKIGKGSTNNLMMTNKFKRNLQIQGTKSNKNTSTSESSKNEEGVENTREMKQKNIANEDYNEKNPQNHKTENKLGRFPKKHLRGKNNRKHGDLEKDQQGQTNVDKNTDLEQHKRKETKEKLGGIIFMCNAKTKPDCFRYHVMGVTMSKKDLVLGVKPGLKLFLYDFDLRLLYGIYKASSSGGMKLEPTAFAGAFPVQVRFEVHQDCYPLPESVFKKAIKENYDKNNKFDNELTVEQVKKLERLFRPAEVQLNAPALHPQSYREIQPSVHPQLYREEILSAEREKFPQDSFLSEKDYRTHGLRREIPSAEREKFPQDSFLSEKDYRTYGLRTEKPNLAPPRSYVAPALETYPVGQTRDHLLRQPSTIYMGIDPPPPAETLRHDPPLMHEKDYQTYFLGARQALQQQPILTATLGATTHNAYPNSYVDQYQAHLGREKIPSGSILTSTIGSSTHASYPTPSNYSSLLDVSSVDQYQPHLLREEIPSGSYSLSGSRGTYLTETDDERMRKAYLIETDHLRRRGTYLTEDVQLGRKEGENNNGERIYYTPSVSNHIPMFSSKPSEQQVSNLTFLPQSSIYASNTASDYNQMHQQGARPESSLVPVSTRYSFAGPLLSYRRVGN